MPPPGSLFTLRRWLTLSRLRRRGFSLPLWGRPGVEAISWRANRADPELGELLPVADLPPAALSRLELEHDDLVAGAMVYYRRFDCGALDEGRPDHRLVVTSHHQDRVQLDGLADVGRNAIDHNPVTLSDPELSSAGRNDGIHGKSARGRNPVVYRICSGPLSTWLS